MRKLICAALLLVAVACWGLSPALPVTSASPKPSAVAVVLLGSLEFQDFDYYDIATASMLKKFPADKFKLVIGNYPQQLFNRYSDKQGLLPKEIFVEEKLAEFAGTHSFDEVMFVMLSAPSIRRSDITIQWENPEVTITARALLFESRTGKKLADVKSTQSIKTFGRGAAKKAAFRKCLDSLWKQL